MLIMNDADRDLLSKVYIAAPCKADWDAMSGDERKRFCGAYKLNVYNVSAMSTREAADLIRNSETGPCLKLYRRKDGTIITDDCPVGLRKMRDRVRIWSAAAIALLVSVNLISSAQAQDLVATIRLGAAN